MPMRRDFLRAAMINNEMEREFANINGQVTDKISEYRRVVRWGK
jgi:hypothetical protein